MSHAYLDFLRDELVVTGQYEDSDLQPTESPGSIDRDMQTRLEKIFAQVTRASAAPEMMKRFAGRYFTEPKSHIYFDALEKLLSTPNFLRTVTTRGVELDLKARLLFIDSMFFINGEDLEVPAKDRAAWRVLANTRALGGTQVAQLSDISFSLLQNLVNNGYLHIG
jgi:50S ribosomal protein L16 3-hydroxylase